MSTKGCSISRRSFVVGSVIGVAGLALAAPSAAFADDYHVEPIPGVVVRLEDADGMLVDAFGESVPRNDLASDLKLGETTRSLIQKADGSFEAICETSILPTINSRTIKDDVHNDPYATIKASVEYTFSRGKIAITAGTVQISNIANGIVLSPRHQLMFQGPLSHEGNMVVKEFTAATNTVVTGWSAVEYVPTGSFYKNACRFQGMVNGSGVQNYLLAAEVII